MTSLARRRGAMVGLAVVLLVVAVMAGLAIRVYRPTATNPSAGEVDAVVVLAGGNGERLDRALELMEADVAPVLVVSVGNASWSGRAERDKLCADAQRFNVLCREVVPDNTVGEARQLSQLAEDEGFTSIAVVTSTYHLYRSTELFRRCFEGSVLPVEAEASPSRPLALHESLGILRNIIAPHDCESSAEVSGSAHGSSLPMPVAPVAPPRL